MKILIKHLEKPKCIVVDLLEIFHLQIDETKILATLRDGHKVYLFDEMCVAPKEQTVEDVYQCILLAIKFQHFNLVLDLEDCDSWKTFLLNYEGI